MKLWSMKLYDEALKNSIIDVWQGFKYASDLLSLLIY